MPLILSWNQLMMLMMNLPEMEVELVQVEQNLQHLLIPVGREDLQVDQNPEPRTPEPPEPQNPEPPEPPD